MSAAFSSAFAWNKIFKDIPYYKKSEDHPNRPNDHGWHKDTANAGVSNGITIGKETITEENVMKTRAKVNSLAAMMVDTLGENVDNQYKLLLSGTSKGVEELGNQFRNGFWTENHLRNTSLFATQEMFSKIVLGQMLIPTWGLSSKVWPVIIMEDKPDVTENPMRSEFPHSKRGVQQSQNVTVAENGSTFLGEAGLLAAAGIIQDQDAAAMRIHHDGKTLWLLDGHVCPDMSLKQSPRTSQITCGDSALWKLPGIDKLDGNNYHGITPEDIVISAYEGYKANGNSNEYGPDVGNLIDFKPDEQLQAPGFFKGIPICDYKTFKTNWFRAGGAMTGDTNKACATYPCCPGLKIKPI
jgi:hypothetical protein